MKMYGGFFEGVIIEDKFYLIAFVKDQRLATVDLVVQRIVEATWAVDEIGANLSNVEVELLCNITTQVFRASVDVKLVLVVLVVVVLVVLVRCFALIMSCEQVVDMVTVGVERALKVTLTSEEMAVAAAVAAKPMARIDFMRNEMMLEAVEEVEKMTSRLYTLRSAYRPS